MNSSHRSHQNGSSSGSFGGLGGLTNSFASRTLTPDLTNNIASLTTTNYSSQQQQQQTNGISMAGGGKTDILIHRLVTKLAAQNVSSDVTEKKRQEFVNKSYAYLNKVLGSDSFTTSYDSFEISEKIKKKR